MEPYRVKLDVYDGPMDLLLYLIRRDELDVYDIPIAHVTEQYCTYVSLLRQVDPNLAGDFLVMAATLMEIKTRTLLPTPPPAEDGTEGLGDPRAELIRQLLEYKAYKDAAGELRGEAERQALRHPRRPVRPEFTEGGLELESVQIWDLLEAFRGVMAAIGAGAAGHEILYDDTPIALHAEDIVDRLGRDGNMTFREIFAGRSSRSEVIGLFLAMLELIRQNRISAEQQDPCGQIYIFLKTDGPGDDDGEADAPADEAADPPPAEERA